MKKLLISLAVAVLVTFAPALAADKSPPLPEKDAKGCVSVSSVHKFEAYRGWTFISLTAEQSLTVEEAVDVPEELQQAITSVELAKYNAKNDKASTEDEKTEHTEKLSDVVMVLFEQNGCLISVLPENATAIANLLAGKGA